LKRQKTLVRALGKGTTLVVPLAANALNNICLERASHHEAGGGNGGSDMFRCEDTTDTVMLGRGKQVGIGNMDQQTRAYRASRQGAGIRRNDGRAMKDAPKDTKVAKPIPQHPAAVQGSDNGRAQGEAAAED
jgi:hypothetical protein